MYKTITPTDFLSNDTLNAQFSSKAIGILFEILTEEERSNGYEYKFDPVWITCAFAEYTVEDCLKDYGVESLDELADYDFWEFVSRDYVENKKIETNKIIIRL